MLKRIYLVLLIAALVLPTLLVVPVASGQGRLWPTKEWPASPPEAQGMDSNAIADYLVALSEPGLHVDSVMIVRHGQVVAEAYYAPATADTKFSLWSGTKSVMSALIGIAVEQGAITSIDEPVLSFFPEYAAANIDEQKEAMTLRDLLTMGSGFACDANAGTDPTETMKASEDWVQFALGVPMTSMPGSQWQYCNMNFFLVSAILQAATGQNALDFATTNLFEPLGINDVAWTASPAGQNGGSAGLQLSLRDWAKFGYLYLRGGEWDGVQVVPAEWVASSLMNQLSTTFGVGYGYGWWVFGDLGGVALGAGGQYLFVIPGMDLLVAVTGSATEPTRSMHQLPAVLDGVLSIPYMDEPLPENSLGVSHLETTIEALANPTPAEVPPLPDMAAQIDGTVYGLFDPAMLKREFLVQYVIPGLDASGWDTQALSLSFSGDEAALSLFFSDGQQETIPVGLDGIYRISEGRLGTVGAKGEWLNDNMFRVYLENVGSGLGFRLDMTFDGMVLEIISFEIHSGTVNAIFGSASE